MLAEVVNHVFRVIRRRDPAAVGGEIAPKRLAAASRAEDLARFPGLRIERENRRPELLLVVAPRVDGQDVQLRGPGVPDEIADVGVHLSDEPALPRRDVEAIDLERQRALGVRVEVDGSRLALGRLRLLGTLRPLREVDRLAVLGEAEDPAVVVRLAEREVERRDFRRRSGPVERLGPDRAVLEVGELRLVGRKLRRAAEVELQPRDLPLLARLRREDDRLLRLVVVAEREEQPVRIRQPGQLRQIRARPVAHRGDGQRFLRVLPPAPAPPRDSRRGTARQRRRETRASAGASESHLPWVIPFRSAASSSRSLRHRSYCSFLAALGSSSPFNQNRNQSRLRS